MMNWDFGDLSTNKYETNIYEFAQDFSDIQVNSSTADILFSLSDDKNTYVECIEYHNEKHSVKVDNNCLYIEINSSRKWYEYIGIAFKSPKITIKIPKTEYKNLLINSDTSDIDIPDYFKFYNINISVSTGNVKNKSTVLNELKISTSTGHIDIKKILAKKIDLSVSTGYVNLSSVDCESDIIVKVSTGKTHFTDVKCKNIFSKGSTGDFKLNTVIASETVDIKRSTGKVTFEDCDAKELIVKTSTGDVKGILLSEKIFITTTDTGKVDVPQTNSGGKCNITTNTGDIKIDIK